MHANPFESIRAEENQVGRESHEGHGDHEVNGTPCVRHDALHPLLYCTRGVRARVSQVIVQSVLQEKSWSAGT